MVSEIYEFKHLTLHRLVKAQKEAKAERSELENQRSQRSQDQWEQDFR